MPVKRAARSSPTVTKPPILLSRGPKRPRASETVFAKEPRPNKRKAKGEDPMREYNNPASPAGKGKAGAGGRKANVIAEEKEEGEVTEGGEDDEEDDDHGSHPDKEEGEGEEEDEDEEEEEEEEEERIETQHSQGKNEKLDEIVKDLSIRFQNKKAKKAGTTKDEDNKMLTKFDETYQKVMEEVEEYGSGEHGVQARRKMIDDFLAHLESLSAGDSKNVEQLRGQIKYQTSHYAELQPQYLSYINEYKGPMVVAINGAVAEYEKRLTTIQGIIKAYTKAQNEQLRIVDEKFRAHLAIKTMTRHSRKLLRAALRHSHESA